MTFSTYPATSQLMLTAMPEPGFREHLNQLSNICRLRVIHIKGSTLLVDSQLNIRAAIVAAGFTGTWGTESKSSQDTQYWFATENSFSKVPARIRVRLFVEAARSMVRKKLRQGIQKLSGTLISCGKHLCRFKQEKNLSCIKPNHLAANTQWHTVRLTP